MKKTITINISGIVFHIEEDGYESLKSYLDDVKRYFGTFADNSEIIADIESRIAEIFMSKLSDSKQALAAADVEDLIRTMGRPSDFKAADAAEEEQASTSGTTNNEAAQPAKKLFRDEMKKVIGGVCAGLGHYFKIDPVWIRLLFALLVYGSFGSIILIYIIMWAVVPGSFMLEEQTSVKKIYRDGHRKVIGGVAAGIASYIGTDMTIVRLIFAALAFLGGFGSGRTAIQTIS